MSTLTTITTTLTEEETTVPHQGRIPIGNTPARSLGCGDDGINIGWIRWLLCAVTTVVLTLGHIFDASNQLGLVNHTANIVDTLPFTEGKHHTPDDDTCQDVMMKSGHYVKPGFKISSINYNAYVNECLARGYDYVSHWLKQSTYQNERLVIFSFQNFFNKFSYFHQALKSTVSRKGMCAFIVDKLQYSAQVVHRLQEVVSQQTESPAVFHPFGNMGDGVVKGELKTIRVTGGFGIATLFMTVYDDTSLKWVFNYLFAHLYKCYSIVDGRSKLKLRDFPSPSLEILSKGSRVFFVTCDGKTVSDFGIEDGDVLQLSQGKCMEKVAAKHELTKQEREGESSAKRGRKAKSNSRKPEHEGPIPAKQDPSTDVLRELHSRAVGPVLDELRPKLKLIRQKLNDLTLQKDLPKERQLAKACEGKENVSENILVPTNIGKAGKSIYHILIGEPNNLYNTGQLNFKPKGQRVIVLDLHGCSRYKAIGVLRKRLPAWVEEAMKGDYPFVIKVDIICGCGHQVLSELVAQFIRDNDQVANRPKCLL